MPYDHTAARVRGLDHDAIDEEAKEPWIQGAGSVPVVHSGRGRVRVLVSAREGQPLENSFAQAGPVLGASEGLYGQATELRGPDEDFLVEVGIAHTGRDKLSHRDA
jgi:hypothetical protein